MGAFLGGLLVFFALYLTFGQGVLVTIAEVLQRIANALEDKNKKDDVAK